MEFISQFIFFITKIYTGLYGEVFKGYFYKNKFYRPLLWENYFYLLPSFLNHMYGRLFSNEYVYQKNDILYLSSIKESKKLNPPILNFLIDQVESKKLITKFSNNIPFNYIWKYYELEGNQPIILKYLKGGIKTKETTVEQIRNYSLINLI